MRTGDDRATVMLDLTGIGIVVGIILCILQGTGTIDIGWFWATFAFWIWPAACISLWIIIIVVALIVAMFDRGD